MTSPKIVHTCMDSRPELKRPDSDRIAADVERFLAANGTIRVFDSGVFTVPVSDDVARESGLAAMGARRRRAGLAYVHPVGTSRQREEGSHEY